MGWFGWFWVGYALALTLRSTPAERCELADALVIAEVTSQETYWEEGPDGTLATRSWLAVEQVLLGPISATATVLTAGGTRDGLTMRVEDEAHLALDRSYLLWLRQDGDAWRVLGGASGVWPAARRDALPEACHAR